MGKWNLLPCLWAFLFCVGAACGRPLPFPSVGAAFGRPPHRSLLLRRGGYHSPAVSSPCSRSSVGAGPRLARRNRFALLRRGRCPHRPALTGYKRDMGISPAGEFLLQRRKRNQKTAGGGSRAFSMPYPASPGPPVFLRGSHQGAWKRLVRRGQRTGHHSSCRPLPLSAS